jgi:hypothetical protein
MILYLRMMSSRGSEGTQIMHASAGVNVRRRSVVRGDGARAMLTATYQLEVMRWREQQ